jgi:hypothetical protein
MIDGMVTRLLIGFLCTLLWCVPTALAADPLPEYLVLTYAPHKGNVPTPILVRRELIAKVEASADGTVACLTLAHVATRQGYSSDHTICVKESVQVVSGLLGLSIPQTEERESRIYEGR